MGLYKASDVLPEKVSRLSTMIDELDWLFGRPREWGLPMGRISLITGARGTGKTRILTDLVKRLDKCGKATLFSQGEVTVGQFVAEKFESSIPSHCYLCDGMSLDDQISAISKVSPAIAITDSVQQIEEYKGGRGAKEVIRKIRSVIQRTGTHVILISQMTTTGTSRGGTELPHEVDIEAYLTKWAPTMMPNFVSLKIAKNRYGEVGKEAIYCHLDSGIECQSENRYKDPKWVSERGSKVKPGFWSRFVGK